MLLKNDDDLITLDFAQSVHQTNNSLVLFQVKDIIFLGKHYGKEDDERLKQSKSIYMEGFLCGC